MAEEREATRVITLDDIKFDEKNKVMAAVACIPLIGLILFFVEKKDLFVRYYGAQFGLLGLVGFVLGFIPIVGWILVPFYGLAMMLLFIYGVIQALSGKRFDVPMVSGFALKMMNSVQ